MDPEFEKRKAVACELLQKDTSVMPEFWKTKYSKELSRNWDIFYKRNTTNFFKDRHWTDREFTELVDSNQKKVILEIGCGVGNFIWPLLEKNPEAFIYACDFSPRAVEFVKNNEKYNTDRCKAFVCDITSNQLTDNIPPESLDIISAIFVFSALLPEQMENATSNLIKVLKPGGKILFRDYGLYDAAQLRFKPGRKFEDNLYVRQDGTFAYYFSTEKLRDLFVNSGGLIEEENRYVIKSTTNIKKNINVERVFLQAKFIKPK
ncbi:hypothetical protein BB560_000173 [Smittium megazygosporum]|uniref:tRNA N(3)-methylcytidine methyltransferase n=1 Tax=Smittium megazygosporum TaxID=133381 RepID=A0A2T9ZL69_9FUNG|nr:hypothetical protein BB560_000173 [Smittium megazygosporum]